METLLDDLIGRFRIAQDAAVAFLLDVAKVPWPDSNRQWGTDCYEVCRQAKLPPGTQLKPHGYGVEVIAAGLLLDFDWGDEGEPDGFDGWRLYYFAMRCQPKIACTHSQLNGMLDEALAQGLLIKDRLLHYDPQRRACRQRSEWRKFAAGEQGR